MVFLGGQFTAQGSYPLHVLILQGLLHQRVVPQKALWDPPNDLRVLVRRGA